MRETGEGAHPSWRRFLANVLVSLGRSDEALPYLVALAGSDQVPQEIKDGVATLLEQIEESP